MPFVVSLEGTDFFSSFKDICYTFFFVFEIGLELTLVRLLWKLPEKLTDT